MRKQLLQSKILNSPKIDLTGKILYIFLLDGFDSYQINTVARILEIEEEELLSMLKLMVDDKTDNTEKMLKLDEFENTVTYWYFNL